MTTAERMKRRRKELDLDAGYVAKMIGVSLATLYRYEKGDIDKVPGEVLGPLAQVLQTTPAWLMGWEELPIIGVADATRQQKSPSSEEDGPSAEAQEAARLFDDAPEWLRQQVLGLLRAAESNRATQDADPKGT